MNKNELIHWINAINNIKREIGNQEGALHWTMNNTEPAARWLENIGPVDDAHAHIPDSDLKAKIELDFESELENVAKQIEAHDYEGATVGLRLIIRTMPSVLGSDHVLMSKATKLQKEFRLFFEMHRLAESLATRFGSSGIPSPLASQSIEDEIVHLIDSVILPMAANQSFNWEELLSRRQHYWSDKCFDFGEQEVFILAYADCLVTFLPAYLGHEQFFEWSRKDWLAFAFLVSLRHRSFLSVENGLPENTWSILHHRGSRSNPPQ